MASRQTEKIWWNKPCVQCGYNLRGLHGDPVVCPECGTPNPRRKPPGAEYHTIQRVGRLEVPLNLAFAGLLGVIVSIGVLWYGYLGQGSALLVIGLASWGWGFVSYRAKSREIPGWRGVFLAYQCAAVALVVAAGPCILAGFSGSGFSVPVVSSGWGLFGILFVGSVIPIVSLLWARRRLRKFARFQVYKGAVDETLRWQSDNETARPDTSEERSRQ